jgi:hypothetical protein
MTCVASELGSMHHMQSTQTCVATLVARCLWDAEISSTNPPSKSSTEAEFVGASNYLPNTIWVKTFLEAQGYKTNSNLFEQDNESAMKLEKNSGMSAGPKSQVTTH